MCLVNVLVIHMQDYHTYKPFKQTTPLHRFSAVELKRFPDQIVIWLLSVGNVIQWQSICTQL